MTQEPNSLSLGPDRPGSGGWRTGRRASSLKQPLNSSLMGLSFAAGMVQNLSLNPQGSHPPYMQRRTGTRRRLAEGVENAAPTDRQDDRPRHLS